MKKYLFAMHTILFCMAVWFTMLLSTTASAQQSISGIINKYVQVTSVSTRDCNSKVDVTSISGFSVGDTVLVIQMKGVAIDTTDTQNFGTISSYNSAGNYEFAIIGSVSGSTIIFRDTLSRKYQPSGVVQLIRVPYLNTNVNVSGTLTAQPWNGTTGGIVVFESSDTVILQADINVSAQGFRAGARSTGTGACTSQGYYYNGTSGEGGLKGEGTVILPSGYARGRGAGANGGGGGNQHNAGGGGGGNFGSGGVGGKEWQGCSMTLLGGLGGHSLIYSNAMNKVFLGGGGGAGHENDNVGSAGTNGGGIVIIRAKTIKGNGKVIRANGVDQLLATGKDGAGGAGAGGSILLDVEFFSGALLLQTNGGKGGNVNHTDCHGTGGGGGGGVIWISGTSLPSSVNASFNGGSSGLNINSGASCYNTSYGAAAGKEGHLLTDLKFPLPVPCVLCPLANFIVTNVCVGDSVAFVDNSSSPGNTTIISWHWDFGDGTTAGGKNPVHFYGSAGTYSARLIVMNNATVPCADTIIKTVVVNPRPVAKAGNDVTLCPGDSAQLQASGGTTYSWLPTTGLNNPTIANPVATPATTTIYVVTVSNVNGCKDQDSVIVTVSPIPVASAGNDVIICNGDSAILTASGGSTYVWNTGATTQSITVSPSVTTKYLVTVTNSKGCSVKDSVIVSVNSSPIVLVTGLRYLCPGDSTILTASGGNSYLWNTGATTASITVHPVTTTKYIVTVSNDSGCSGQDTVTVTVNPRPVAKAEPNATICRGDSIRLHASGGTTYSWSPTTGLSDVTSPDPIAGPSSTTTYIVTVTNAGGCSNTDSVVVTILPAMSYSLVPNPVDLGITNVDSTQRGKVSFQNNNTMRTRVKRAWFQNAGFGNSIDTQFPITVVENGSFEINFRATPHSEGTFTGELCIGVDSACPVEICIPVKIEAVSTCFKLDVANVAGKRPGEMISIPIILEPSKKFATAKKIEVTVKFNRELLRLAGDPLPTIGKIPLQNITKGNGEVSFVVLPDSMPAPNATIATLPMQALLAPYLDGVIKVIASNITLNSGEQIAGANCPATFSLDSSCVRPSDLKPRSSAAIEGLYPNPSYKQTTLSITTKNNPHVRLELYDAFGRLVNVLHDGEMVDGSHEILINTENYANGIYFCRLVQNGQITTKAFNVER